MRDVIIIMSIVISLLILFTSSVYNCEIECTFVAELAANTNARYDGREGCAVREGCGDSRQNTHAHALFRGAPHLVGTSEAYPAGQTANCACTRQDNRVGRIHKARAITLRSTLLQKKNEELPGFPWQIQWPTAEHRRKSAAPIAHCSGSAIWILL